jgi:hypothetical protein
MVFRKRRRPTPGFKIPPPFNPVSGDFADLSPEGVMPYCALMQVAADDTYADYVICRGFDTRLAKFVDYEEGNPELPGISVAKPYGNRKPQTYEIGEIYPAFLPLQGTSTYVPASPFAVNFRLGQNPGVVTDNAEPDGHPSDLDSYIDLLIDYNGKIVNWLLIDTGAQSDGNEPCEEVCNLQPGIYRGIAGATIAPGETGPVIVTGCEDDVTIDAVNHSGCTFYLGDLITVNVDPCCVAHFTGCSCCGAEQEPPACCDRSYAICICGQNVIFPASGSVTIDVSDCCECDSATLTLTFTCEETEESATISGTWSITCDGDEDTGELDVDLSLLCDDENNVSIEGYIDSTLCFLPFTVSNYLTGCTEGPGSDDGIPSGPDECFCWDCPRYGVLVEVTGVANNTGPGFNPSFSCTNCDEANGTYFLPYPAAVSIETCTQIFMASGAIPLCNPSTPVNIFVNVVASCEIGQIRFNSQIGFAGAGSFPGGVATRQQVFTDPVPCPLTSDGGSLTFGVGDNCSTSGANITSRWV